MSRTARILMTVPGAMIAAGTIVLLSPAETFWAFGGWTLFFVALWAPFLLGSRESWTSCSAFLSRLRGRS